MQNNVRPYNTFFRMGGDEFILIISNTTIKSATKLANRLLDLIATTEIKINNTITINTTVSMGLAEVKVDSNTLKMADQALYKAKEKGRNQIVNYS